MVIDTFTKSPYLYRKIELELDGVCLVTKKDLSDENSDGIFEINGNGGRSLLIRGPFGAKEELIPLPFAVGELRKIMTQRLRARTALYLTDDRYAFVGNRRVKLTELEYATAKLLIEKGDFVSKTQILKEVWGDEKDPGIVTVYIHYLRSKLEASGERVILSSRQQGYRISEAYLKGGDTEC